MKTSFYYHNLLPQFITNFNYYHSQQLKIKQYYPILTTTITSIANQYYANLNLMPKIN